MKRSNKEQTGKLNAEPQRIAKLRNGVLSAVLGVLCVSALIFSCSTGIAAVSTNDLTTLLQRGLFEEEANRNLDAAIANYDALAKQFDRNRQIAATAIFRLGECYRKLGRTNDAVQHYERILREFPDQQTLATLSRQNLVGMRSPTTPSQMAPVSGDTDASTEARALAAKLNGIERFKDDPEKHAKAVLSLFPDERLRKMLSHLPFLKEQEAQFAQGKGPTNSFYVAIGDPAGDLLDLSGASPSQRSQLEATTETQKQLAFISERVNQILSEQRLKLDVLQAVADDSRPEKRSDEGPILDDEEKEIGRIQAMIRNSPDLINAPAGDPALTPLARAASQGYLRVAEFLLNSGAQINQQEGSSRRTPLHHAVYNGHRKMAELLISRGADVNAETSGRATPLYMAVQRRFQSLVELLLKSSADPNLPASLSGSRLDETPLMFAVRDGNESLPPCSHMALIQTA